ncbi:MAG: hypothetical protein KF894_09235 [Labilithrix sp.]|nr:hypothetical protein [Labilithrix sp.]
MRATSIVQVSLSLSVALAAGAGLVACAEDTGDGEAVQADVQEFGTGPKLAFDEYTVLFTNPVCKKYAYTDAQDVFSNAGTRLLHKPENVFCAPSDAAASGARDSSPQKKLVDWIADPETKEIFFTYLSFSNKVVSAELCKAVTERNVKITMVLDRETDLSTANQVLACQPGNGDASFAPHLELRGHDATIGYAHNKVLLINPRSEAPRIVFSSGNLTSGAVLHHENWHFIRAPARTHFAKAHVCMMDGMLEHYRTKREFSTYIKACRDGAGVGEESDIKTFFVPGDGGRAGKEIQSGVRRASFIGINAHRFSYRLLRTELEARLASASPPAVKLIVDDDLWWAGQGTENVPNTPAEYAIVQPLAAAGVDVRYMETNQGSGYLHHNKFIVFETPQGDSVFTGAGNFTGTAFADNFENFYLITIPHVVEAMKAQQEHLFALGTAQADLPTTNVRPPTH